MTMQAMVLREHGGPEVLREEQLPVPEPGPGQVRVRVRAVAPNHCSSPHHLDRGSRTDSRRVRVQLMISAWE